MMDKILEFGKRALFVIRVISGYEERRIRSCRLQLQKRIQEAQERKAALRRIPEQVILSEVRHMVEEMQAVQRSYENMEAEIKKYFDSYDKDAEIIMKMQLQKEEKSAIEMLKVMREQTVMNMQLQNEENSPIEMLKAISQQAIPQNPEEEKIATAVGPDMNPHNQEPTSTPTGPEQTR